jgi:hypothetical protein
VGARLLVSLPSWIDQKARTDEPMAEVSHNVEELNEFTQRMKEVERRVQQGTLSIRRALAGLQYIIDDSAPFFPVWKGLRGGITRSIARYRTDLDEARIKVSEPANDILDKVVVASLAEEIKVVNVAISELGLVDGACTADVFQRGAKLGLQLCSSELGPALRLFYSDQPKGESLNVAMEPILGRTGLDRIFNISHLDSGLWLDARSGHPENYWPAATRFLFIL